MDEQLKQAKDVWKQLEECAARPKEAGRSDKRQRKITDKGREMAKEKMAKTQDRVKIYEEATIGQRVPLLTPTMAGIKESDSRYLVMTKK